MTPLKKISSPGELLALVPYLLGFEPKESIVIASVRARGELGLLMRVDRRDCLIPEVARELGQTVASHMARDAAHDALLISYTRDDVRLACDGADALRESVGDVVGRVDTWAVSDGRYYSPGCADTDCCPATGLLLPPVDEDGRGALMANAMSHSAARAPAPEVTPGDKRKAARASDRWWARRSGDVPRWRQESWKRWCVAIEGDGQATTAVDLGPVTAGKIVASLQDREVRDAAVMSVIPGALQAGDAVIEGGGETLVAAAMESVLSPVQAVTVEPARAIAIRAVLDVLMGHARKRERAPLHTLVALLAWWEGDRDVALRHCELALVSERGYRLAELLKTAARLRLEPGWRR